MKRGAKAASAFNTGVAERGCLSSEMFVVDKDEKTDVHFSAKARLSRDVSELGDKNSFEGAVARWTPVE